MPRYRSSEKVTVPSAAYSPNTRPVNDLATSTKRCTIAIWHEPYTWTQETKAGRSGARKDIWERLYAAGAEIVINGHRHQYERFAPMTPSEERDDVRGIRQFIVGTGGETADPPTVRRARNSQVLNPSGVSGVLKLTLETDRYSWEFLAAEGASFTDSGTTMCH